MRFLIIVFCLLSEKFIPHHLQKLRTTWLEHYSQLLKKHLPAKILDSSNISLYLAVVVSLVLIANLFSLGHYAGFNLIFKPIFDFLVFYLCLGEHNLFFMNANSKNFLKPQDYILAINQEFIAIILWFFIFGPAGALIYRVTIYFSEIQEHAIKIKDTKELIDWLPSRISAFLFLMVGHFQPGISSYLKNVITGPAENSNFLLGIAEDALSTKDLDKTPVAKLEELFTHSCLLLIFILAIYMIGRLL